jgi:lipopolysaccharide/colanic/teichoic acid biosynthesis glycosyltransferase
MTNTGSPLGRWLENQPRAAAVAEHPRGEMASSGPARGATSAAHDRGSDGGCRPPGLTCLWQVSGRNELTFDEWMRLDLEYIDNWSLWLDLRIVFKTIPAVVLGRGAR